MEIKLFQAYFIDLFKENVETLGNVSSFLEMIRRPCQDNLKNN